MVCELHCWPTIQGRGEFVRLALEEAGAPYVDIARVDGAKGRGMDRMLRLLRDESAVRQPFAAPILKDGRRVIARTAVILLYLGDRHGLAPKSETDRLSLSRVVRIGRDPAAAGTRRASVDRDGP